MKCSFSKYSWPVWLLGLIFLAAGLGKLGNSEIVFAGVMQYQLVEANTAFLLADTLPWVEIFLGVLLFIPRVQKVALATAGALQLIFLAALIQAAYRGLEIVCVCFGTQASGTALLFLQEVILLALTAFAFRNSSKLPKK